MADRLNRTLVKSARSMLLDANLSSSYWAKGSVNSSIPKELLLYKSNTKEDPLRGLAWKEAEGRHLRMFGCDAYAHVPKDERGKFYLKARECILLCYGEEIKGYRSYDVTEKKILYSRDVEFNEDGRQTSSNTESEDYKLIIDMSSDIEIEAQTEDEQPENKAKNEPPRQSMR